MFKPNKTAVAGLICGLFVTSAALAQDATLPDSLTGDVSYDPDTRNVSGVKFSLFEDQDLKGNNHNLTISTPSGNDYWTRLIAAGTTDVTFSNIGTLKIEDHATRPWNQQDGLIWAKEQHQLLFQSLGSLDVVSDTAIPIHSFGGTITVEPQ